MALQFEPKVNKKMSRPDPLTFPKGRFLDYHASKGQKHVKYGMFYTKFFMGLSLAILSPLGSLYGK